MNRASLFAATLGVASLSPAAVISQFNFNSVVNDATTTTGSPLASSGLGTAAGTGGVTTSYSGGSNDDANTTDNSAFAFATQPAQGTNSKTAGIAFTGVSTLGQTGPISISFSLRASGTASRYYQLQETTDGGVTYADVTGGTAGQPTTAGTTAIAASVQTGSIDNNGFVDVHEVNSTQVFIYPFSYTLATGDAGLNNALFGFRIVTAFAPATSAYVASSDVSTYATTGNTRIDSVTVATTPEPAALAVAGVAAIGLLRRRRA